MTSMQQIPSQLTPIAFNIAAYRWKGGVVADNFAGGGGASTGISQAIGRSPDIAVNHDEDALAMHEENHPDTVHYRESVWQVDVRRATGNRPVLFGWFSPDCTHFSVAKGGKPVKKNIRGLAWVAKKWAGQSDMAVLFIENVKEFQTWGPLIAKRCKVTGRVIRLVPTGKFDKKGNERMLEQVAAPGERVPYAEQALVPDKKRAGQTFRRFVNQLRGMGYNVEWRASMVAADYGMPTSRSRFFLVARKDGLPITWPEPTHGDPASKNTAVVERLTAGVLKPWAIAGDHLDFTLECRSIFDPDRKPLAEATLRRIAKGIQRFVIEAGDNAFLVKTNHAYDQFRGQSLKQPLQTIPGKLGTGVVDVQLQAVAGMKFRGDSIGWTIHGPVPTITAGAGALRPAGAAHALGIVAATLTKFNQNSIGQTLAEPIDTVMAGAQRFGVVEAELQPVSADFITTIDHGSVKDPSTGLDEPLTTMTSKARHVRVAAMLKHFTGVVGQELTKPCPTITATDHNAVVEATLEVAHLQRDFGNSVGQPADEPVGTIMPGGGGKTSLVTSSLVRLKGTCQDGQPLDTPLGAIQAQGNHYAEVRAFLLEYYSTGGQWCDLSKPINTIPASDRFALVTIKGVDYQIVDIGMRMLEPYELYRCQGFPAGYKHRVIRGKPLPKHKQVRMVGNSVPPGLACALVESNIPQWALEA